MTVVSELCFDDARQVFYLYCRSKGLAERTLQTYFSSIGELRAFLAKSDSVAQVPSAHELRSFVAHLLDQGLARTTISIRMRAIRSFCNFLAREGIVPSSPMAGVPVPKVPSRYPEVLTGAEAKKLVCAATANSWGGTRNRAMVLTLLDTGVRLGELIRLDLVDLQLRELTIRVRSGKGDKERHVFMGRSLSRALRTWIEARGAFSQNGPLFMTRRGERLDRRNVQRILERLAARTGFEGTRVSPHLLRHTFATHYIMNGGDPFSLQRILGHSDIKTTMIYVNIAGPGLREAHAKASPVDRLLRDG
jgi:integrase/recombinase XerD